MKINWFSNAPWAKSGYGNQTALMAPRIKALGHDVSITATYGLEGYPLGWNGMTVYPRSLHQYGQDVLAPHSAHFRADITISLFDSWVFMPEQESWKSLGVRWVPWFPIDMDPIPPIIIQKVAQSFQPVVFSRWAEKQCRRAGLDVRYVPHGYDPALYSPGSATDKKAAREKLGLPADAFVVGMVAANQGGVPSRKAYPQQLEAFAALHRKHSDTVLYLHTREGRKNENGAINLPELAEILDLKVGRDVFFCDQYYCAFGFPDEHMPLVYRAFDVLTNVSLGEGFGIPIMEAQACGTPVIVGDWTAMSELCFGGWKVDRRDAQRTYTPLASYMFTPRVGAIADALEAAYDARQSGVEWRDGLSDHRVDNVVNTYWRPVLDEIAQRVESEKVPVCQPQ